VNTGRPLGTILSHELICAFHPASFCLRWLDSMPQVPSSLTRSTPSAPVVVRAPSMRPREGLSRHLSLLSGILFRNAFFFLEKLKKNPCILCTELRRNCWCKWTEWPLRKPLRTKKGDHPSWLFLERQTFRGTLMRRSDDVWRKEYVSSSACLPIFHGFAHLLTFAFYWFFFACLLSKSGK
jgi:hypothetical protein